MNPACSVVGCRCQVTGAQSPAVYLKQVAHTDCLIGNTLNQPARAALFMAQCPKTYNDVQPVVKNVLFSPVEYSHMQRESCLLAE